jgi:CHAD domain-containing protein
MESDSVKLKDIKPLLMGYISESKQLLLKSTEPDEKVIHDVRVLLKKARALLKLISPQITDGYIERDIEALREAGRLLGSWREISVHRKTLKIFKKKFPEIFSRLHENPVLNSLLCKPAENHSPSSERTAALEKINSYLGKTAYRIRFQQMNNLDPQFLLKSLETTYLKVSSIYVSCRNNQNAEELHKLRQKAKDFLYQIYIFRPLNTSEIKSIEKKLGSITDNLGKLNDINQIIRALGYDFNNKDNSFALDELVIKFREAQDKYLEEVWPNAYRIFCPGRKLVNVLGFKLLVI